MTPHNTYRIALDLGDWNGLLSAEPPSPFHARTLHPDAACYIERAVAERPLREPVSLAIQCAAAAASPTSIEGALRAHFADGADQVAREVRLLMKAGRRSLLVGLAFLAICLFAAAQLFPDAKTGALATALRESLTIAGWVAMWRSLEIYLYDWWPLCRRGRVLAKLASMPVQVSSPSTATIGPGAAASDPPGLR